MRPLRIAALGAEACVVALLLALLPAMAPAGVADPVAPSGNVRIDTGLGRSLLPALAAEPSGRVHAVWADDRLATFGIHYSRSVNLGATWEADRRIDMSPAGAPANEPDIAVDLTGGGYAGALYVVWQSTLSGEGDIWFTRSGDNGTSWSLPITLDLGPLGTGVSHPSVAVAGGGKVFVTWADNRDGTGFEVFLRSSADGGAAWSPEVAISGPGGANLRPSVAAKGDDVYVAWIRTDLTSRYAVAVAASGDGGTSWESGEAVSRAVPETIRDLDVAVGVEGDVHVAWIDSDAASRPSVGYARSDELGRSFTPAEVVAASPAFAAVKEVRVCVLGPIAAVAWSGQAGVSVAGDTDIYYAWSGGGPWSAPIRVDDTDANPNPSDDLSAQDRPAIVGSGSTLYFAWSDLRSATYTDIYASRVEWTGALITEMRDSPDGEEFVELYGWSRSPVPVSGWSLEIDGTRFDVSGLREIPPGAHVTVGDAPSATLTLPIDLNDEGSEIVLRDSASRVVDAAGFGQRGVAPDPRPGDSTARYSDGDVYGRAWTWVATPTPGSRNAVPPPEIAPSLVLNEVLFNPSTPGEAFVEIYYRGAASVTVSGLHLLGDVLYDVPATAFSASQRYYVVLASAAPAVFAALGPSGDNVYLADANGRLLDEAGWSSPHAPDTSMARVRDGAGGHTGYDDGSSIVTGWRFDAAPSLPGISIGPDQGGLGDLGAAVPYDLVVRNEMRFTDDVEVDVSSAPIGWRVDLLAADGVTPLSDTNGNGIPNLRGVAPLETRTLVVRVHVPWAPPIGDTEVAEVSASAFSNRLVRGTAWLSTATVPHIEPRKWADPAVIYAQGSPPPLVTETTVHLEIEGSGQAIERRIPQDTIFVVDSSGSMTTPPWNSDPTGLRIDAIKAYIDGMAPTDRAAIVGFAFDPDYNEASGAWLVNDVGGGTPAHLTWMDALGKAVGKNNAETMRFGYGGTNIEKALQIAHQELLPLYRPGPACLDYPRPFPSPPAGGMTGHAWVEILLTDGLPTHGVGCTDDEVAVAQANGIRIFTIGLGGSVDATYLGNIANRTGAKYYKAATASDLLSVYSEIATFVSRIAGYDANVTDDLPMITDVVPANVDIVPGSFRDPATGAPRAPDFRQDAGGRTVLEWNVSELRIGDRWGVEYRVSTAQVGRVPVSVFPEARVTYLRWDGQPVTLSFPPVVIDVLGPPPRVAYAIARSPSRGYVVVDRVAYLAPAGFTWTVGETHEISVPTEDLFSPTERDLFDRWDDGGGPNHTVVVGGEPAWITAYFVTQFRPEVELRGTDPVHSVAAHFTFRAQPASGAGASGTWSDWVDAGTSLSFDPLARGSDVQERWITREDFSRPPWDAVASGFQEVVEYVHQAAATVRASGLHPEAPARVTGIAFGAPIEALTWGTWADWVDVGSRVAIENPVGVSPVERFASRDADRWTVAGPLDVGLRYYHQWQVRVQTIGLDAHWPAALRAVRFDEPAGASVWEGWEDWVDDGGGVSVDTLVMAGSRERFVTVDPTAWSIRSAGTLTVRYAHEYAPTVTLVGTDAAHTVSLTIRGGGRTVVVDGLRGVWADWVEAGTRLEFSASTNGTPQRFALDPTGLEVTRAFDASIRYAPREPNLKPLLSLLYVVVILGTGAAVAHRRPLDIFVLPSQARRRRVVPGRDIAAFRVLPVEDAARKLRGDRRLTFCAIGVPVAAAEGVIGILSLLTGFLRVPDAGNWFSLGLIVNTIVLGSAIGVDAIARRKGYRPRRPGARATAQGISGRIPPAARGGANARPSGPAGPARGGQGAPSPGGPGTGRRRAP